MFPHAERNKAEERNGLRRFASKPYLITNGPSQPAIREIWRARAQLLKEEPEKEQALREVFR